MVISHRIGTNHPLKSINMSSNKKKNIHVLIQECTEHLRFLGYSEDCITLHQKKWSEYLLPYLQ